MIKCDCTIIHEDVVDKVKVQCQKKKTYIIWQIFKVFGDSTRIKIISALLTCEMCVCDIAALLNMTHSSISHQLRVLKQARLVKFRREARLFIIP